VGTDINPPPYYTHYFYHQDLCNVFVGSVTIDDPTDPNTTFNHFVDEELSLPIPVYDNAKEILRKQLRQKLGNANKQISYY